MSDADIIGSAGVFLLLLAFFLNLFRYISAESILYTLLNAIGAAMGGYASWLIDYMPFVILEFIWTIVSLVAFVNVIRKRPA